MQAYSSPERENDPHSLPDVEIFHVPDDYAPESGLEEGWYWWACFSGCLPDSDPIGPFASKEEALADAQD